MDTNNRILYELHKGKLLVEIDSLFFREKDENRIRLL